jgi:eukaryotic-like serine/threonine-protein kinase
MGGGGEATTIGRYEVVKTIGKGAMGVVYKARDPLLDRVVAIKTIVSPKGHGKRVHKAYLERFEREAKAAAKMQHPAIVTIFDVGLDGGAPFMVLEYLPGESLADRLDRVRIPLAKGISIALDLASALAFAHRQRIVHRDVKPANVLHAGESRWKLADFGIARLPDSDLTQVGIFMGTPGYSPPEAIREGRYTAQADVFAWGAVLYELLSGRIPYEGPDTQTTNSYVLKATAPSPRQYDPSIPEPIADVVMRALDPSTATRYKDAAEAEESLRKSWEKCLTSSLVSPAALTGEEVPHERAPLEFHSTSAGVGQTTVREPAPPAAALEHAALEQGGAKQDDLVIESSPRVGDDDPTTILIRDSKSQPEPDLFDSEDPTVGARPKHRSASERERAAADADSAARQAIAAAGGTGVSPWVIIVAVLLAVGGIAAFFLVRM